MDDYVHQVLGKMDLRSKKVKMKSKVRSLPIIMGEHM